MSAKENADYLMDAAMKAGITDPKELANFMGQMQVESGGFARMSEGLGYSGSRLLEVFPGRNGMNTLAEANKIAAGGPEAIANEIYGGTWGKKNLGNTEPGDGWTFHGRGYVQLTGRAGYEKMGKELGLDLVHHPELAEDKDIAARIAIQYWKDRVQAHGHQTDVDAACRDINGGHNGLSARRNAAAAWEDAIEKGYKPGGTEAIPTANPSHGLSTEKARHVQALLNAHGYTDSAGHPLKVDGHAGKETRHAIERFQADHHLKPDGVVGPATLKALETQRQHHGAPSLEDARHPSHNMYRQALDGVQRLDAQHGRACGPHTSMIAGSLAAAAVMNGMRQIDQVMLNDDASRAYAVQGNATSPFKQIAEVDVLQAARTPLAQSSVEAMPQNHAQVRQQLEPQAQSQQHAPMTM